MCVVLALNWTDSEKNILLGSELFKPFSVYHTWFDHMESSGNGKLVCFSVVFSEIPFFMLTTTVFFSVGKGDKK